MIDLFSRTINYMRISITDRCNLRCIYCMPHTVPHLAEEELLGYEEILQICTQGALLGIRFIKLTGGEPLMREGVPALVGMLKNKAGIEKVSLTTNGVLLSRHLDALCAAGIDGITISLDSLNRERFKSTTGYSGLDDIVKAVYASVERDIRVKINAVLIDPGGESEWRELAELARALPLDVRFIEMMPLGYGSAFKGVGNDAILSQLKAAYTEVFEDSAVQGAGPAVYYRIRGFKGAIGFISAMSHSFCHTCNRIRLTAEGMIKPCLCYAGGIDLKAILRDKTKTAEAIKQAILEAVAMKPASHCFTAAVSQSEPKLLEKRAMAAIGG
ncbi:MAG: GTP 3',8-cyclase MoaA [Treponema sp.]|jgi:cyclic pyranopterin phosphate synthase|nr:GTP 3',8-cyclase MoaA [Treponema sp.]